jgi:hypothetical protein
MSLLLNTPVTANIQGYAVLNCIFDLQGLSVQVVYAPIVGGSLQSQNQALTPVVTETAFEALAGATTRLKALQAVANALNLAGGTYTIS